MRELARETGRPVTFACSSSPIDRRSSGGGCSPWSTRTPPTGGALVAAGRAPRPTGVAAWASRARCIPFLFKPRLPELAALPLRERRARSAIPRARAHPRRGARSSALPALAASRRVRAAVRSYPLGDPPDYEPGPDRSRRGARRALGGASHEVAYDLLLEGDGHGLLYFPILNYANGNLDASARCCCTRATVFGLSDGGAHCGAICDASMPTFMLTHWVRDRTRGARIPLELVGRAPDAATPPSSTACSTAARSRPGCWPT